MELMGLLIQGLVRYDAIRTQATLGNRSAYIGMSDIAKAADCLRAAVAGKMRPVSDVSHSLTRELRLQRGHWFEAGVADAFRASGMPFLHQLAIHISHNGVPMRAHLDFVFVERSQEGRTGIHVVECKSCEHIPETAYAAHEMQMYGQIGLLLSCFDQSYFTLIDDKEDKATELVTISTLIKKHLGLQLPIKMEQIVITGFILTVSMNDAKVFGPYLPNAMMLNACLDLGESIWRSVDAIRSGQMDIHAVPTTKGHHPLCDYCEMNSDCPRFTGVTAPELEEDLLLLQELKREKDILCQRIRTLEEELKATARHISPNGNWINAVTQRFRLGTCEGRKTLDKDLLASALATRLPGETADNVIQVACSP
jgi:hypothetical protein